MNIPQATPYRADKRYADEKFYSLEGFDGYFRRLKGADKAAVIAYFGDDNRVAHFEEVYVSDRVDAKPTHAPGPKGTAA